MRFQRRSVLTLPLVLITAAVCTSDFRGLAQTQPDAQKLRPVELISAEELKAKFAGNTPLTIIDVRATDNFAGSGDKIKGAIHVKLRRLKSRLAFVPFSAIPRDREVVTYCACPSEEASIAAARILLDGGFKRVRALKGGWQEWLKIRGPLDSKPRGL